MKSRTRLILITASVFVVLVLALPGSHARVTKSREASGSSPAVCVTNPTVTTNADSGAGSLRQAILDACPGSTITFDSSLVSPITLTSAELQISKDLTIQGPAANPLTITRSTADATPDFRIFNITSGTVAISRLTVTNGKPPDGTPGGSKGGRGGDGGGIKNSGTLTLTDVVVSGNRTGRGGNGGSKSGDGGYGGGIYNTGALTMTNCIVNANSTGMDGNGGTAGSSGGWGGGIYTSNTMNLINVVVSNNSAGNSNNVDGFGGQAGGIFMEATSTVTMVNSTVSGNSSGLGSGYLGSPGEGGGLLSNGVLTIANSTISGNLTHGVASGIYTRGVLTLTNSTVSGNQGDNGSAIGVDSSATMTMTNCTVANNTVFPNTGIGVAHSGAASSCQIKNSIIAGNGSKNGADLYGNFTSQGFNLIGRADGSNGPSSGFTNGVNGDKVGTSASPLDARLAPLANYGGTTQTHLLLPDSPAIDAGSNALIPPDTFDLDGDSDTAEPVPFDQRGAGFPRVVNTTVDMGAVEVSYAISATAGSGQSAAINTAFATQLKATVTESGILRSGISITFTAPSSGASGAFMGGVTSVTVNTDSNGVATAPVFTANGTIGSYNVLATLGGSPSATFNLTNTKVDQTISFGPLMTKTYGDAPFNLIATATSGLPVTFSIILGPATVSGNTVTLTGAGIVTIRAMQAGDSSYNAAPPVNQSFMVNQGGALTTITSSNNPSEYGQLILLTATVTTNVGVPTGVVQLTSDNDYLGEFTCFQGYGHTCSAQLPISNLTTGTHDIRAFYTGDANFTSSFGMLSQVVKSQPTLSISDISFAETDSGTTNAVFTVTLSAGSGLIVKVVFGTMDGTAMAGSDFQHASGTLTFNPFETQKTVSVPINGDTTFEPDETFFVNLGSPENATIADAQAVGTILNDDPQGGVIHFGQSSYTLNESNGPVSVTVQRTGDTSAPVSVSYATSDGAAQQRTDYTVASGTINFAAGETTKNITLLVNDDNYVEGSEQFSVTLSNATGGAVLGAQASATVTINDNDLNAPNGNLIDDAQSFVYQHYHDFLSREPDADGLAYWAGQITACGSNQSCINARRVDVSNAFFFELEYQQTGAYVYRLYRAAYGNNQPFPNPGPDSLPADPVKAAHLPGYAVFSADRARVVGGSSLAQSQLDLANAFVQRPEFLAKFPASLSTGAQFVDAVLSNISNDLGVDLSAERDALVAQYNTGGRGMVLYRLADDNAQANPINNRAFIDAEYNRAFVLTEYFGYLRRDPDVAGINFWLGVLSNFPVRDTRGQHAMVCSFITSREYQERFSSVSPHSNQECGQ